MRLQQTSEVVPAYKCVCITTKKADTKSNHSFNPNPDRTTKQHAVVSTTKRSTTQTVVTCPIRRVVRGSTFIDPAQPNP